MNRFHLERVLVRPIVHEAFFHGLSHWCLPYSALFALLLRVL
jgi:hypothetical protein